MMDVGEFLTTPAPSTKRFAGAFAAGVGVGAALALVLGRRK
jgi:ABC-type nitrate/sulfonate/bicarbonate transport system permease component